MNRSLVIVIAAGFFAACDSGCVTQQEQKVYGLMDSTVVCETCSPEYLRAKTDGIMQALRVMVREIGDVNPRFGPITFHLDMDKTCRDALTRLREKGDTHEASAFAQCKDVNGEPDACDICLLGLSSETVQNAKSLADQALIIHEAGHVWWKGRENLYFVEEPMVQMLSYSMCGQENFCTKHAWTGKPLSLVNDLCALGVTGTEIRQMHTLSADRSAQLGRALNEEEFAEIVSAVMGRDMRPSFVDAGILPSK